MTAKARGVESQLLQELIGNHDVIAIATIAGERSADISASTSFPGQDAGEEKNIAFIVPDGYVFWQANSGSEHHPGDAAHSDKANGDPHDGSWNLRVHASQTNGYAHAWVSDPTAIKPQALLRLHQMAMEKR
jgi:hypothetical protein